MDFERYKEKHFKSKPKVNSKLTIRKGFSNVQFFRFKGTNDIIVVAEVLNEQSRQNWDKETFYTVERRKQIGECHLEEIKKEESVSFLQVYDEKLTYMNFMYFQNKNNGATLNIQYYSDQDYAARLNKMRLILKELKTETF